MVSALLNHGLELGVTPVGFQNHLDDVREHGPAGTVGKREASSWNQGQDQTDPKNLPFPKDGYVASFCGEFD